MLHALTGSVMVSLAATLAGPGNVLFSDDFSKGDGAWIHGDLLDPLGGSAYDTSTGAYEIRSNFPLPPLPIFVGEASAVDGSGDNKDFRNCTIRCTARMNNENTNIQIVARANLGTFGRIGFNLQQSTGNMSILAIPDPESPTGTPPLATVPFAFEIGRDYHVVVRVHGDELSLKVWGDGDPEPDEPQVSANSLMWFDQSGVALVVYNVPTFQGGTGGQLSGTFDDVLITRGGE